MKAYVMAAVAAFFLLCGVAVAQTAVPAEAPAAVAAECPFKAGASDFECADAAKAAFEAFGKKAGEADVSAYPDLAKELHGLRGQYLKWFDGRKAAGLLKKGTTLYVLLKQAVEPVIIATTNAVEAKHKKYYDDVTYRF